MITLLDRSCIVCVLFLTVVATVEGYAQESLKTQHIDSGFEIGVQGGWVFNGELWFLGPRAVVPLQSIKPDLEASLWHSINTSQLALFSNLAFNKDGPLYYGIGLILEYAYGRDVNRKRTTVAGNIFIGSKLKKIHPNIQPYIETRILKGFSDVGSIGVALSGGISFIIR